MLNTCDKPAIPQVQSLCECCCIRRLVTLSDLSQQEFRVIHRQIAMFRLAPGEVLYGAGDSAESVFTIRAGLVKLVKYLPDGGQRIVRLLRPGDLAGIEALGNKQPYEHLAIALEPVSACRIPIATIERLVKETPGMWVQLMTQWQRTVQQADIWLSELSMGPSRSRVARLLLRLVESAPDRMFYLPGREDMGAMLAITTETASRTIAEFKRKGFIQILDGYRAIAEIDALQQIANA